MSWIMASHQCLSVSISGFSSFFRVFDEALPCGHRVMMRPWLHHRGSKTDGVWLLIIGHPIFDFRRIPAGSPAGGRQFGAIAALGRMAPAARIPSS
jgi:hypothetical protein